jgi:hypothetical protein
MNKLAPIIIVAAIANIIIFSFYFYAAAAPGGSGLSLVFALAFPVVWVITLIIVVILVIRGRKVIFKRRIIKWTIPVLLFSTPIPFLVLFFILNPPFAIYGAATGYYPHDGYTIKTEEWDYPGGKPAVTKYFKLNSEEYESAPESAFQKDSVWVYFDKAGDTTKMEWYKNGRLIRVNKKLRKHSG